MLDGAVALFDSVAGVEPQSETVWRQADKYGVGACRDAPPAVSLTCRTQPAAETQGLAAASARRRPRSNCFSPRKWSALDSCAAGSSMLVIAESEQPRSSDSWCLHATDSHMIRCCHIVFTAAHLVREQNESHGRRLLPHWCSRCFDATDA